MTEERSKSLKLWLTGALLRADGNSEHPDRPRSDREWQSIDRFARQHRLRTWLHRLGPQSWNELKVPAQLLAVWHESHRRTVRKLLAHRSMLAEMVSILSNAGVPFAVLKGGALWSIYSDPALRPARDIDILVMPDQAEQANAALQASGCILRPSVGEPNLTDYSVHKHLEPLWCPRREVSIEIHTALVDRALTSPDRDVLMQVPQLLERRQYQQLGSRQIPVLAWPETLLHLIAHAVYDHQMNNGPLVLTDCAEILAKDLVDWDEFWRFAETSGRTKGARLVLDMVAQFSGAPASGETPAQILDQSALLMLQDMEQADVQGGWSRLHAQPSLRTRAKLLIARAGRRARLAKSQSDSSDGSSGNLGLALRMVAGLVGKSQRAEIQRSKSVFGWLR